MKSNKESLFSPNDLFIISSAFGFVLGVLLFTFFTPNYYDSEEPVQFEISEGSSLTFVIDQLYKNDIIPSKYNMHIAAFLYGADRSIKAGRYEIPNGLSYFGMLDLLIEGSPGEQTLLTVPEGIWQFNLAKLLKDQLGLDSAKFMALSYDRAFLSKQDIDAKSAEGFLLPDSYFFYTNCTEEEVFTKLNNEMDKLFDDDSFDQIERLGMTKKKILVLASIIDGESNITSEFKRIAGVYYNRLKRGMKLQADPTIQYLIRHRKRHNKIYYKDLEIDSPFNTYKYYGLPPAPINNPGKNAVYAALYPEEHDYYYFVADGNGGHVFAKTGREHNRNVAKYRKWRRKNN